MRGCPDCPRGLTTCVPLDNVIADDGFKSFVCVGLNDGSNRTVVTDYLTLCVRAGGSRNNQATQVGWEVDELTHVDRLDLGDQAAVISSALVMDERLSVQIEQSGEMIDNFSKFKQLREEYDAEETEGDRDGD